MRWALAAVGAAVVLAGCGSSGSKSKQTETTAPPALPRLSFAYPKTDPLSYHDVGVVLRRSGVTVDDVLFKSGDRNVDGYLVHGVGKGRRPAVVIVTGEGGDRTQLLGAAVALAKHGVVVLTV